LTVTAKDAHGNVLSGYTGTVTLGASDATVTLSVDGGETYSRNPSYSFTSGPGRDNGTHTFDDGIRFSACSQRSGTVTVSDASAGVQASLTWSGYSGACAPVPPGNQSAPRPMPTTSRTPNSSRTRPPG
jgi:hypothetical protein